MRTNGISLLVMNAPEKKLNYINKLNFMKKLIFFWLLFIVWSCKHQPVEIKIDNITSNKIEYTIHNYSNEYISILIPNNNMLCDTTDSTNNNNTLSYDILDSKKNILPRNINVKLYDYIDHLQKIKKIMSKKIIILPSNSSYKDSVFIPINENECDEYCLMKKNKKYYAYLSIINKDSAIISNLYKFYYK